jgi:gamma-glutamyltranspeptidase
MADEPKKPGKGEGKSAALRLAEEMRSRPYATAAIGVGAAAATAGAVMGARALARRHGEGKLNSVLKNAMTASEAAAACRKRDEEKG